MADLRDSLAEERTFLAWIRTGVALMGFGFAVARFGGSLWFGSVLIAAGVAVNLRSARRYSQLPFKDATVLSLFLGLVGIAMAISVVAR